MPVYAVYLLVCPLTGRIRYVGQTSNLQRRFIQHLSYRGQNLHLNAWIADLAARGYVPLCKTLLTVETLQDARRWERFYIVQYLEAAEPLCNVA